MKKSKRKVVIEVVKVPSKSNPNFYADRPKRWFLICVRTKKEQYGPYVIIVRGNQGAWDAIEIVCRKMMTENLFYGKCTGYSEELDPEFLHTPPAVLPVMINPRWAGCRQGGWFHQIDYDKKKDKFDVGIGEPTL